MASFMYKEVTILPENPECWTDEIINAGASQSTLQDIKLPETAGYFAYSSISNRFIYWRTSNDVLELVETSFDVNLRSNHLRLRFQHAPVLQGVSIHETFDHVVILVPTVSTIHRFNFRYPKPKVSQDYFSSVSDVEHLSIFHNASSTVLSDHTTYFVLNHASTGVPLPHTSCSWLTQDGDAAFVLANSAESHLMVIMEAKDGGKTHQLELKRTSVMSRLWNGLVRSNQGSDMSLSLVCHQDSSDVYIFSLCRDLRIRMWSQNKQECLMTVSTLEHCKELSASIITNSSAQHCWLRKSVHHSKEFFLGVYLSLPQFNQFLIFQPLYVNEQYHLSLVATLMNSRDDLVDFCVNSYYVWGLWLNSENIPIVKVASIESNDQVGTNVDWMPVGLESCVSNNIFMAEGATDYTEVYLNEIFKPGRFSSSTIAKVLYIYNRATNPHALISSNLSFDDLRQEVLKVVFNEIGNGESEGELEDEELQQLTIDCWDKFFSYCIQYHEVGLKPLGLSVDPVTGCGMIVKKNAYSVLCPCDTFEHLRLADSTDIPNILSIFSFSSSISEDPCIKNSVLGVLRCMNILKSYLSDDMVNGFEYDLSNLQTPDSVGLDIVSELIRISSDPEGTLLTKLQNELQTIPDVISAFNLLIQEINIERKDDVYDLNDNPLPGFADNQHFLFSSVGLTFLSECFNQYVTQRFYFSRDLLLLELLMTYLREMSQISVEVIDSINLELLPSTKILVSGYYVLKWMSETAFTCSEYLHMETGFKQLALLGITDDRSKAKDKSDSVCRTLVYYYIEEQGRMHAYAMLSSQVTLEEFQEKPWMKFLPQLITNIASLLWPMGPYFQFPVFLLNNRQCSHLQNYTRLLSNWCDWNAYSRYFLDAFCFLVNSNYEEAIRLFVKAADGIHRDDFLRSKILCGANRTLDISSPLAQYYMEVIQFLEQYAISEHIIELATIAIGVVDKSDPYLPIFWSVIFKHHLELGHSEDAYTALTCNPDKSRQKDCLRQLIVEMCKRKEFHLLVKFPYMDMQDEVVAILEMKARSSDLLHQSLYDLLYAFHMETNNFRKAATVMYECSLRLSKEVNSNEGLQKQSSCLLSTINCLNLVDPKYAWIIKPIPTTQQNDSTGVKDNILPKRAFNGQQIYNSSIPKKKVEVLEIVDIRREYDLVHARLLLVQQDQSVHNLAKSPLSASECVTLLIKEGFFDIAIGLSLSFSLPLDPVFEGLTYRCIITMLHPYNPWLKDKETEIFDFLGQNDSSDLPAMGYTSAKEQVWYLLKHYLNQHEKKKRTKFHRCIVSKLLSLGIHLPVWLKHSYQKRNSAELLWLYIKYDALEEATKLAIDLIDVALGKVQDDLGIPNQLRATNHPVWLPHTYFDALRDALEDVENEINCTQLYKDLTAKLEEYVNAVQKVSEEMILLRCKTL